MDQIQGEESPSLVIVTEDGALADVHPLKNHTRDAHILSFSFFFIFCAYCAAQNLESSVNAKKNLGTTSLGILYTSFTLFSVVASPVVRGLGTKRALVMGTSGYLLFIGSNFKPSWYTMVPASLYLGFTASIIWVSQGTYLTSAARSHARDCHLHEGKEIGNFNGEFWGMFASTQEGNNTNLLFTVFLGCIMLGAILMCFLSERDDNWESLPGHSSVSNILKSVVAPLLELRVWLIIPLIAYSGLQLAFVWSEFTKHVATPALGVSGMGGAMAIYGAAGAICSLVAGRLTSGLSSLTWIVAGGAFLQTLVMLWLLFSYSSSSGKLSIVCPLVMAALWGVGNGVINTQLNVLLGLLFKHDMEGAFAQLRVWQSGAIAVLFFLSPYISLQMMLILMLAALFIALSGLLYLTRHVERSSTSGS